MEKKHKRLFWSSTSLLAILCAAVAFLTYTSGGDTRGVATLQTEYIPAAPDYQDTAQWYVSDRQAPADLFYIISTEIGDYQLADGRTGHYADTAADSLRTPMMGEMRGVDHLLSGDLNYFSPYYRQCTLESFVSDSLMKSRLTLPTEDVRQAFRYYLDKLNGGRPFIIAGFSQGALILLDLLREMDDDTFQRMIAAYAIGVIVADSMRHPHIVAAKGADDTGVTICYNSVRDVSCALPGWEYSSVAINPVNWCTDATPATLITEPSPMLPTAEQKKDQLTVRLDTLSGLLLVDGFTATDYVLPLIGKEGNYHSREIWLYRQQLRDNMALRASRFMTSRQ